VGDIEDRLRALDPAAHQPYHHADLDAMISRVTAVSLAPENRAWRNFKVKMASAVVASALITAGAVTAFTTGPALAVLALAPQHVAPTMATEATAPTYEQFESPMRLDQKLEFAAGPRLDSATPSSNAYLLSLPDIPSTEAIRIANVFGVAGATTLTGTNAIVTVNGSNAETLTYSDLNVPQWTLSATTSAPLSDSPASALAALPSNETAAKDAQRYINALGYNYGLSAPSFGTTTSSNTGASGAKGSWSTVDVSYNVLVNGVATHMSVMFSIDATNTVVSASGPAFNVTSPTNYPLQSPTSAIAQLNAAQNRSSSNAASEPVAKVTIQSSTITLSNFVTADGNYWLLPTYQFSGDVANTNGSQSTGSWSDVAVDPSYLSPSTPSSITITSGNING
jgi:hypothetical protein